MSLRRVERNPMGTRIRELRRERGLTLQALAQRVGISPSHLSRLERGWTAPSFGVGAALARELGVTATELAVVSRTQTALNRELVAALVARGMEPEIAVEVQRSISTDARAALLRALASERET